MTDEASALRVDGLVRAILATVHSSDARGAEPMIAAIRATARITASRGPPHLTSEDVAERLLDVCVRAVDGLIGGPR